jgi:hypothetical protein
VVKASLKNAFKVAAHRAAAHVQDDKDRAGWRVKEYDRYVDRRTRELKRDEYDHERDKD